MRIKLRYFITLLVLAALLGGGASYTLLLLRYPGMNKMAAVYGTLQDKYVEKVDKQKLVDGAIDGMMKALDDPYSTYMDQAEAKSFEETISASFVGIGAEIQEQDGFIAVVAPIKGSPAEKAGIKQNDRILKVNGISLEGMKVGEAVKNLRGEKGTKAELVIKRPGEDEERTVTVIRDTIPVDTVHAEMLDDQIGRLEITSVAETTADEYVTKLKELQQKGMKKLIIDLRQNPGGLLNVTVQIANTLIPDGKPILQVEQRYGSREMYKSRHQDIGQFPVVALVDEGTASAAEILAGALQESAGVKLVGQKTFGKGTVQTTTEFKDGSNIKYTIAKWLTPNGNWIHKQGIKPDVAAALPAYANLPVLDPDKELKPNTFSNEVKAAQQMLAALGYDPGREDGFYDDSTKSSVSAFQNAQGLPATGSIQGQTTIRLMDLLREKIKANDTQLEAAKQTLKETGK